MNSAECLFNTIKMAHGEKYADLENEFESILVGEVSTSVSLKRGIIPQIEKKNSIVVFTGEGGIGKTYCLYSILKRLLTGDASQQQAYICDAQGNALIPFFIETKHLAKEYDGISGLVQYIKNFFPEAAGVNNIKKEEDLVEYLQRCSGSTPIRLVLLIDGLNEIAEAVQEALLRSIASIYNKAKVKPDIICSARIKETLTKYQNIQSSIEPLSKQCIEYKIENISEKTLQKYLSKKNIDYQQLNSALKKIITNRHNLRMFLELADSKKFGYWDITQPVQLYIRYHKYLSEGLTEISREVLKHFIPYISFLLLDKKETFFTIEEFCINLDDFLVMINGENSAWRRAFGSYNSLFNITVINDILPELIRQKIIVKYGENYSFSHDNFIDFYAALHIYNEDYINVSTGEYFYFKIRLFDKNQKRYKLRYEIDQLERILTEEEKERIISKNPLYCKEEELRPEIKTKWQNIMGDFLLVPISLDARDSQAFVIIDNGELKDTKNKQTVGKAINYFVDNNCGNNDPYSIWSLMYCKEKIAKRLINDKKKMLSESMLEGNDKNALEFDKSIFGHICDAVQVGLRYIYKIKDGYEYEKIRNQEDLYSFLLKIDGDIENNSRPEIKGNCPEPKIYNTLGNICLDTVYNLTGDIRYIESARLLYQRAAAEGCKFAQGNEARCYKLQAEQATDENTRLEKIKEAYNSFKKESDNDGTTSLREQCRIILEYDDFNPELDGICKYDYAYKKLCYLKEHTLTRGIDELLQQLEKKTSDYCSNSNINGQCTEDCSYQLKRMIYFTEVGITDFDE